MFLFSVFLNYFKACLTVLSRSVFRPKNIFKCFYDKKKVFDNIFKSISKLKKNTWEVFFFF